MRPHEKLDVWKKAVDLVLSVYDETRQFPIDERFGLNFTDSKSRRFNSSKHCRGSRAEVEKGVR